jgi:hypothetical protein
MLLKSNYVSQNHIKNYLKKNYFIIKKRISKNQKRTIGSIFLQRSRGIRLWYDQYHKV